MSRFFRTGQRALTALAAAGAVFLWWSLPLAAQTVRPVLMEYQVKARGRFEVVNDSVFPLNVVLEPKSFSLAPDGSPTFRPLDSHIRLKLSSMSFRLPPRQTFYVFYEATADTLPAWFTIYCTFNGLPPYQGINIAVDLPHTVYLLQRETLEETGVHLGTVEFRSDTGQVVAEVENSSDRLGRALEVRVSSDGHQQTYPGFPLLPLSRRQLQLEWEGQQAPEKVEIRFRRFKLEGKLQAGRK